MTSYWLSDICVLFHSFEVNPFRGPDKNFRYNALTRLIILVTAVSTLFFNNYKEILLAGISSLTLSVVIYFLSFNKDMAYNKNFNKVLESIEKTEFENADDLEKIKLLDQTANKKSMTNITYKRGIDTDNLSKIFFIENSTSKNKEEDLNDEKYNIAPINNIVRGKVSNDILKSDITNEFRVSDLY
jgi:hypothetical protein